MKSTGDPEEGEHPADHGACGPQMACRINPLARRVLEALSTRPESGEIVLGGYFALQRFLDYRTTHDIDAWWRTRASHAAEDAIREAMRSVAAGEGYELRERRFGDTVSFELSREGKKRFSFQIAVRSVELDPPLASEWPPILIETLRDNLGAKMNALVDRGAPRDFVDVRRVVEAGLTSAEECWKLWSRKNPVSSVDSAKEKVLHHLTVLSLRRPLEGISDPGERSAAASTRNWFRRDFLGRTE